MTRTLPRVALSAALLLIAAVGVSGCAGVVVGAGATAGVALYEERSLADQKKDAQIYAEILSALLNQDEMLPVKIGTEVFEGRVMLTGVADSEQMRADAVRLAWTAGGVEEVLNEIQLGGGGIVNLAHDSWITAQLKAKLTFDREILSINYSVETVNGIVYLIGIAQNQAELDRVIATARAISYVRDIISHVRVKGPS